MEKEFGKLEKLLEKLSEENLSLDEKLKIYVEAKKLIKDCKEKLAKAKKAVPEII